MKFPHLQCNKAYAASFRIIFLFALLVTGCDSFESDVTDPVVQVSEDELYVLAGSEVIIDLKALVSANFAGKLSVTGEPRQGTLHTITDGLLRYKPDQGLRRTRDKFEFTVFTDNNSIATRDTVYINIETDSTNLPCRIYPNADYVNGLNSGTTTIDVLKNDIRCGHNVSVEVYQPTPNFLPSHGTAAVNGTNIVYTPGSSFTGKDTLIYKVINKQDPASFGYGFVYINRDSTCRFDLVDDNYRLDTLYSLESYFLNVFANDLVCDSLDTYTISVLDGPSHGNVFLTDSGFTYRPYDRMSVVSDEFKYALRKGDVHKTAHVTLSVDPQTTPCQFQAESDTIDITALSTSLVYLDVLRNDQLCDSLKTITIALDPKNGTAFIDGSTKRIGYNRVVMKSDSLQYEICNGKDCSRATAYIEQGE